MKRQRKHSQDILDKLEEARKNKHLFLEQTGVDMKVLAENGLDANNGIPQLRPVPEMKEEHKKLFAGIEQIFNTKIILLEEHNNYRMYSADKQAFMNVKHNIPTHIGQWKLMFINSKDKVVFYRKDSGSETSKTE